MPKAEQSAMVANAYAVAGKVWQRLFFWRGMMAVATTARLAQAKICYG